MDTSWPGHQKQTIYVRTVVPYGVGPWTGVGQVTSSRSRQAVSVGSVGWKSCHHSARSLLSSRCCDSFAASGSQEVEAAAHLVTMKPEDMELEGRQESEIRQREGGGEVGDDEPNRVSSEEDLAALVQRLLEEKAKWDQEKDELKQEKDELKQENTELGAKVAKRDQENAELKQENAELDANVSVKKLLETFNGIPPMETNTSATPSLNSQPSAKSTGKRNQARRGAAVEASKMIPKTAVDDKVDKQRHAPAVIQNLENKILNYMEQCSLNLKDGNDELVKSMITSISLGKDSTNKEAELSNFNKASVSLHVTHLLQDVLQCLHLSSTVDVGQEISIFSMRPDVVVVRWQATIILVIEVKNPGEDGKLVVQDNRAAGQVYDYSMGLYQMGITHPFVCLSTYDYMRIGTLVASPGAIFPNALEKLKNGTIRKRRDKSWICIPINPNGPF